MVRVLCGRGTTNIHEPVRRVEREKIGRVVSVCISATMTGDEVSEVISQARCGFVHPPAEV